MTVLTWCRGFGVAILFLIQTVAWFHLYTMHHELAHRMDELHVKNAFLQGNDDAVWRTRREIQSSEERIGDIRNNSKDDRRKVNRVVSAEKMYTNTSPTTNSPIIVRQSRTKNTGSKRLRHRKNQENYRREAINKEYEFISHNEHKSSETDRTTRQEIKTTTVPPVIPPVVIHYMSDTYNYSTGKHPHYLGNGRIKVSGVFTDWKPAPWSHTLGSTGHFKMQQGKLTINEPGVYLFYAQIHYANIQEMNGYRVFHNNEVVAQCSSTTAHPDRHEVKSNTCSLSTTLHLSKGDTLWLHDLHQDRFVILTPPKSYFGLVLLYPSV